MIEPKNILLFCPKCSEQHIDKAEPNVCQDCGHEHKFHFNAGERNICAVGSQLTNDKLDCYCDGFTAWLNPPHKSHRCHSCNHVWRPFEYPTNGIRESELLAKIKNVTDNEKLIMQAEFYLEALEKYMPFQPEIWTGGSVLSASKSKHLRLIWLADVRKEKCKSIELFLSDSSVGFFNVDGNKCGLNWIATEQAADESFKSAFGYIFGEKI